MAAQAVISIAGRVMLMRKMGKMIFFNIVDEKDGIQIFADIAGLGEEEFLSITTSMRIGDIVGLAGILFRTRTGEKTVRCQSLIVLTPSLRPLP